MSGRVGDAPIGERDDGRKRKRIISS